jgi:hypothetical protein
MPPKESVWREDKELYRLASLVGTDAKNPEEKLADYIETIIATAIAATEARVLERLKKKEEPPNAGYSAVEASMYAYAKGYNQCVEDVRALFSSKTPNHD